MTKFPPHAINFEAPAVNARSSNTTTFDLRYTVGREAENNHECREHIARILAEGALVSGVACK